jgi:hypothetical protein
MTRNALPVHLVAFVAQATNKYCLNELFSCEFFSGIFEIPKRTLAKEQILTPVKNSMSFKFLP